VNSSSLDPFDEPVKPTDYNVHMNWMAHSSITFEDGVATQGSSKEWPFKSNF
jgi:hypothetical protein